MEIVRNLQRPPLFPLGQVVATCGAIALMAAARIDPV